MIQIFWRDLKLAYSTGGNALLGLSFFLMICLLVPLSLGSTTDLSKFGIAILWLGSFLSALLSLDRIYQMDHEDGTLEQLLLSDYAPEQICLAKILAHWMSTGFPVLLATPLMMIMLGVSNIPLGLMLATIALGSLSFSALGALTASITLNLRRGGILLSVLTMPMFIPSLILGTQTLIRAEQGLTIQTPLLLLAAIALFSLVLSAGISAIILRIQLR